MTSGSVVQVRMLPDVSLQGPRSFVVEGCPTIMKH